MLSTVLIIDQRKELSIKYKKSISTPDINVVITGGLKDAIQGVQNLEPDLIIISDSIEEDLANFCQKLRALTFNTRPIIVALSKSADSEDRINVLENGADDFISEPVNIDEFKTRIQAHLRRDLESNLETKTLLPNQKYVRKTLKRVLNTENFAVLMIGITNIQNYKIIYTDLAADKLIQTFVAIAKSALEETDFIGQLNETEFIIVTNKFRAEKLAEFLTFAFDTVISKFYSQHDNERGYMLLKGESYEGMRVNFVSIIIGGIIDDFKIYKNVDSLIDRLSEIKNLAKITKGSNYVIDRIKLSAKDSVITSNFNNSIYIKEQDESLAYLIRTTLELQGYDVQDELYLDSTIQPSIIIIDSGKNCSKLDFIRELKEKQNFVNTKFIVTTTYHSKSEVLDTGADLYLPKPYEIGHLIKWVEHFLR